MFFIGIFMIFIVLIKVGSGIDSKNQNVSYYLRAANLSGACENVTKPNIPYGCKPHPTIVGGYVATMKEFPFAVRVYTRTRSSVGFCTAQCVTTRLVLTAAHCVMDARDVVIVGGQADHTDYVRAINVNKYARYRVTAIYIHPNYIMHRYRHDVAVVKTGRDMLHKGHGTIALSYVKLTETVPASIYGWGETEKHMTNNVLYGKHLKAVNCSATIGGNDCYDYVCLPEKGICHGDSGGGLIVNGELRGVASFYSPGEKDNCTKEQYKYFYASLWAEREFVSAVLERNGSNYNRFYLNFTWVFLFYLLIR